MERNFSRVECQRFQGSIQEFKRVELIYVLIERYVTSGKGRFYHLLIKKFSFKNSGFALLSN